jgi:salicylate hydroxylase
MTNEEMSVAVVGAGISGLTVAAALIRAGIDCQVYEQAPELGEVGAGIQISPNASRILHRLGLQRRLRSVAVRPEALEMRRWDDNAVLMRNVLGEACASMYEAPYYSVHRADLHRCLLELLPEGRVHLGRECVAVIDRPDGAELRFADGSSVTADVVIGADGIHSKIRQTMVADRPRFSGQTIYRGLIRADRLAELLIEPKVIIWLGPGQHCVCYPISSGRLISFAATTPAEGDWHAESWSAEGRVDDLLAAYQGWNDEITRVLKAAETVHKWALHDRDTLDRWSGSRVTLVGDAAHPMLPFGAQGANQAIEDAAALAVCLRGATPQDLTGRLRRYEEIRRPRTETVHKTMRENARNHHYDDGAQQQRRDEHMNDKWGLRGQEWLFGYDAELAAAS